MIKNSIASDGNSRRNAYYFPDEIMKTAMNVTCGISVGIASSSAIAHYFMGVGWISIIEIIQLSFEIVFWVFGVRSKKYRLAFQLALAADYIGISSSAVLGGNFFLTNVFWLAVFPPLYIISGSARLGYIFFSVLIVQIVGLTWWRVTDPVSVNAIVLTEGFLFAVAIMAFVLALK